MKYLLDTHVFIWWLEADQRLSQNLKRIIDNPNNIKFVSVATFWEIIIKVHTKKLFLKTPVKNILKNFEFETLEINLKHVLGLEKLPDYHKDPFDRMLIAQAKVEDCTLITNDPKIQKYKVKIVG
ncbi:hypothetical protein A2714_03660 [Candidatus Woesebacteria bacterium RIFCSPHIGHO2_01_FULL_38_9]|uniref:PIN domain-containing protein n=2 Tax=Candidatus Woeseibacteriota TaxID=1752722 RepID=A0A1F7Y0M4_9BACT|nr:MAG: hypothetical protein A2714_03660 [Candidatus Woesebacteria bacterium RIFCSPHIGHO2_01_FULL_38_9]OGM63938.1 MAG: hypothetical protein A2893_00300 [Candidatus Woesebacteria bacterium RIFCSPLOWO2_01_FULL_39_25]